MEETTLLNFDNAVWYKLAKDRTIRFIPLFTDYNVSTRMGATLYDRDIVPCKLASELPVQFCDDPRAWYLNLDSEDMQAAGIAVPEGIETAYSLIELRGMFNRQQRPS